MTRRHTALSPSELQQAREGQKEQQAVLRTRGAELTGEQFKHRHAALQQTVGEQRRLLKEQQEQILHLQQRQNMLELRHEVEKTALLATVGPPGALSMCSTPDAGTDRGRGSMKKKTRYHFRFWGKGTNKIYLSPHAHYHADLIEGSLKLTLLLYLCVGARVNEAHKKIRNVCIINHKDIHAPYDLRAKTASGENGNNHSTCKTALGRSALPHPSVQGRSHTDNQPIRKTVTAAVPSIENTFHGNVLV